MVGLPSADTLTPSEVARLLRAGDTRVLAIIGPSDAGKSSLIASLYDLFQEGPVAGVEFARSRSLHAFERTCHDARAASRRRVPHINRTPLGEVRFYHLDLGGGAAGDGLSLALGDRAGEQYRGAADDPSVAADFSEVRRADSLTLLVDGERLLDSGTRHNVRNELAMIVQALVDEGAVRIGQRLALVLTKVDLVLASPDSGRAGADFESLLAHLDRLFGAVFSSVRAFRIAASPKADTVPRGTGVSELLAYWLEPRQRATHESLDLGLEFARAFARLHVRLMSRRSRREHAIGRRNRAAGIREDDLPSRTVAPNHREGHPNRFAVPHAQGRHDATHLIAIAARWRDAKVQDRTAVGGNRLVSMNLKDAKGAPLRVIFPDVAGESFRRMWEDRDCDLEIANILQAGGVLLFIHADAITPPRWVVDEVAQMRALGLEIPEGQEAPWHPRLAPTQVQLVDLLQLLRTPPLDVGPRKLAIMLSVWDKAEGEGLEPEAYLEAKLPLLAQYLRRGADRWTVRIYGLSAQGGDYDPTDPAAARRPEAEALRRLNQPSTRIRLVGNGWESHDLTEPLAWLMQ